MAVKSTLMLHDGMSAAMRRINNAMGLMINNFEAVQRASGSAVDSSAFVEARKQIAFANRELDDIEAQYRQINGQQERLNRSINTGVQNAGGLLGKLKGVAGAYLGIQTAGTLVNLSDTQAQTNTRLGLMVDGNNTVEGLEAKIKASAERSRALYQTTADAVSKLGMQAGEAFGGNDEIIQFTELLNKSFVIAGTSAQGIDSVMLQLTQAMAAGKLQGEELNAILDNAQPIVANIKRYLEEVCGIDASNIKELAADGRITADIIKNAMFRAAGDINANFDSMPTTWSQIWTSAKNKAISHLEPVLQKIGELANNNRIRQTVDSVTSGVGYLANGLVWVFERACDVYYFISENWGRLSSVIVPLISAVSILAAVFLAYNAVMGIATAAQWLFNTALFSCPLVWILMIIIAAVLAIYKVVEAINNATDSTLSATGIIMGALAAVGAFVWNLFLGCLELVFGILGYLVNPFIDFANFVGNVFENPVSSVIYLFQGMADNVLLMLQKIASAMDYIFGSNMADTVKGWRNELKSMADEAVKKYAPNENYQEIVGKLDFSVEDLGLSRLEYADAYSAGYNFGEDLSGSVSDMLSFTKGIDIPSSDQFTSLGDIAVDTSSLAESSDKTKEELAYLRDIAEKEAVNRFTTAEIKVDMSGMTNRIDSDMDIDGVISHFADGLADALNAAAEGAYDDGL